MLIPGKLYKRNKIITRDTYSFSITKKLTEYHVNDTNPNNFLFVNKNNILMFLGLKTVIYSNLFKQERLLFLTNNKLISLGIIYDQNGLLDILC